MDRTDRWQSNARRVLSVGRTGLPLWRGTGPAALTWRGLVAIGSFAAATLIGPAASAGEPIAARELSAPPADLESGRLRLGEPPVTRSDHALLPVVAVAAGDGSGAVVQVALPHGAPHGGPSLASPLTVALAMASPGPWRLTLVAPDGTTVVAPAATVPPEAAKRLGVTVRTGDLAGILHLDAAIAAERIDIARAPGGTWTLELRGPIEQVGARGAVIVGSEPDLELRGRFDAWTSRVGVPRTYLLDADGRIDALRFDLVGPDGRAIASTPVDHGTVFTPSRPGRHILQTSGLVTAPDGRRALRSIETVFEVSDSTARLTGAATTRPLDAVRTSVDLEVAGLRSDETLLVAGEVWATHQGVAQPICWIASIAEAGEQGLSLALDRRWLGRAGLTSGTGGGTLELRDVRLQTRSGATVVDQLAVVPLGAAPMPVPFDPREESSLLRGRLGGHAVATPELVLPPADDAAPGSHALMLVHGYCSDATPFTTSDFTGSVGLFQDFNAARSNDEFALLIAGYGANFKSYGTVAHSQGGLASLHLYAFYWSGLDWANGPRLIQSVGAPYQGTPLAGNLAVLGGIFGVGCGAVTDMTPDGATAWLSTIPTWARQKVWYWTTSYKDYPFSYDYCDFISDLFLSNPDDGVIEKSKGQLPGANNMGHTEGWCHVEDMEDPAQCTDHARNATMNANAAR